MEKLLWNNVQELLLIAAKETMLPVDDLSVTFIDEI